MSLTPEQLEQRKRLLTASDVPAVLGVNPWRTPFDVWLSKIEPSPSRETWRTRRGHIIEPLILDAIAEQRGVTVARAGSTTYTHSVLTWLGATPDGLIAPRPGQAIVAVAEAKEVGPGPAPHWLDEDTKEETIPLYVTAQVQVQMTVMRSRYPLITSAMVGVWLPGEPEPHVLDVDHDPGLETLILERCDLFWRRHVLAKVPPASLSPEDQAKAVRALFPRPTREAYLAAAVEHELLAAQYIEAREAEKAAKKAKEEIAARLITKIAEAPGIEGTDFRASYKVRKGYRVEAYDVAEQRVLDVRVKKAAKQLTAASEPQEETSQP